MKPPKKINSYGSKYQWLMYANSYLTISRIGLLELTKQGYINEYALQEKKFSIENKGVLLAVLWNFKHAIEITMKSFGIVLDKEYLYTHDQRELFDDIKQALAKHGIDKSNEVDKLDQLIDKYYYCNFWNSKMFKEGEILDVNNDIFRYPENLVSFSVNVEALQSVTHMELKEIYEDLKKLRELLGKLHYQLNKINK